MTWTDEARRAAAEARRRKSKKNDTTLGRPPREIMYNQPGPPAGTAKWKRELQRNKTRTKGPQTHVPGVGSYPTSTVQRALNALPKRRK